MAGLTWHASLELGRLRRPRLVRVLLAIALLEVFGLLAAQPLLVPFST